MNNTFSDHLPMPQDDDMPPLPRVGEVGPQVCATVQLYLGVMDDLTAEQVEIIQEHVRGCADCARVQRVMQGATQVFGGLPGSVPSSRVDEAVLAAIAARGKGQGYIVGKDRIRRGGRGGEERVGPVGGPGSRRGGSGREHVETVMPGSMDVVAVGDGHSVLGMDMMHHVAQQDAKAWSTDESMFNLAEIRSDMKANRAVFMGKGVYRGEAVYQIHCSNGLVLLLNMRYEPVNVLHGPVGTGAGEPMYDALVLMPSSHVSSEMWDMRVPRGYKMGVLPGKP